MFVPIVDEVCRRAQFGIWHDGAANCADIGAEQEQIDVNAMPVLEIEALRLHGSIAVNR